MKIIKNPSATEVIVEKTFSKEDLNKLEEAILKTECRNINIPGFRPGNVPLDKVREILISSHKWEDLMGISLQESIVNEWNDKQDEDHGELIKIINVNTLKTDPLILECHFEYFPHLKIEELSGRYKKLKLDKEKNINEFEVSEKEVDEGIKELQKRRTILKPVTEPLGKDKYAFILLKKNTTNATLEEKEKKELFQWGIGQIGKEFDEKTEGMKEGEEKEIDKDKSVKIEKIFVSEAPEINDEFAKSLGHFSTLTDLKFSMKEGMLLEKLYKELDSQRDAMIKTLIETIDVAIPDSVVKRTAQNYKKDFEAQLGQMGDLQKKDDKNEKFDKVFEEKAKKELKLQRILEAIALEEKIVPEDEEVTKEVEKALQSFKSPKEARETLGDPEIFRSRVILSLCFDKTIKYLEEKNNLGKEIKEEIERRKKEVQKKYHQHDNDCGPDCDHDHDNH